MPARLTPTKRRCPIHKLDRNARNILNFGPASYARLRQAHPHLPTYAACRRKHLQRAKNPPLVILQQSVASSRLAHGSIARARYYCRKYKLGRYVRHEVFHPGSHEGHYARLADAANRIFRTAQGSMRGRSSYVHKAHWTSHVVVTDLGQYSRSCSFHKFDRYIHVQSYAVVGTHRALWLLDGEPIYGREWQGELRFCQPGETWKDLTVRLATERLQAA
jgi:hypothetical protein